MTYIYDKYGIPRRLSDLNFIEKIFELKQKSGRDPWPVVEKCLDHWSKKEPKAWKSFLINVRYTRETRRNNNAASDSKKDLKNQGTLRYTLDLPEYVVYMLRMIYTADELPMNQDFFDSFAARFPRFKVAQK